MDQFVCFVVTNDVHQPVVVIFISGWWSPSKDVRVIVLLRPRVFVNKLPSSQGPGQRLDGAEHVVVDSDVFDDLARVFVQLIDGVEALVGAVVPNPG